MGSRGWGKGWGGERKRDERGKVLGERRVLLYGSVREGARTEGGWAAAVSGRAVHVG